MKVDDVLTVRCGPVVMSEAPEAEMTLAAR